MLLHVRGIRTLRTERRVGHLVVPHQLLVPGQDVRHDLRRLHKDLHPGSPRIEIEDPILRQLRKVQVQVNGGSDFL